LWAFRAEPFARVSRHTFGIEESFGAYREIMRTFEPPPQTADIVLAARFEDLQ
jgi:hypothetical protein